MSKYATSAELGMKSDSEGGFCELLFGYGLDIEDLPDDMPGPVRAFVRQLKACENSLNEIERYLDKAVADHNWEDQ